MFQKFRTRVAYGGAAIAMVFSLIASVLVPIQKVAAAPVQAPFTQTTIDTAQAPWGKNLADLNGDGKLDAIEGGGDNLGGNVYWYEYPTWTKYQIGSVGGDDDLQVADMNGDGATDVIVNGGLSWYANPRGTGGDVHDQWTRHIIDSASNSHDLQIGDLNADGKLDVVVRGTGEVGPTTMYLQGATPDAWTKVDMTTAPVGQGTAIADINRDGYNDIVGNGYWLQNPIANTTSGAAWTRHDFVNWTQGASVNVADINRDGRVDIFIAPSEAGTGTLSWFQNPTDPINGTWTRHDILTDANDIHRFHLADMNKDGNLDLVFAEMHQSPQRRVGVFYNDGSGLNWTLQLLSTNGSHNIAVGDVEGDGDVDILGANWALSAPDGGSLNLWRNDLASNLGFASWTYAAIDTNKVDPTFGLNFGDLNRDGLKDVIAGHYLYKNPGAGMLSGWNRVDLGNDKDAMLTTDVDGDGQLDIIAQSQTGGAINVYWLKPTDGTASAFTTTLIGNLPYGSRDYTSQGYDTAKFVPGARSQILFGNDFGDFYFTIPSNPSAGNWPRTQVNSDGTQEGVVAGDINGDGRPDVIGSSHSSSNADGKEVDWWTNPGTGAGNWTKHVVGTTANEVSRVRVADVNNDGRLDVIAADDNLSNSTGNLYWFEQTATGTWLQHTVASNLGSLESMDIGDFNDDGKIDIVSGDHRGDGLQTIVWENVGAGTSWVNHVVDTGKESHLGTRVSDLDGDGDLDIVSVAYDAYQTVHLWRNDATSSSLSSDTTPPVISSVATTGLAPSAATVTWTTDEPSDSQVEYGATTAYGSTSPLSTNMTVNHSVTLTGLAPNTTYHFRVASKDAAGNLGNSDDFTFKTLTAGAIAYIQSASNTSDTAAANISQNLTASITAGDTIVAAVSWGSNASITCSDSQGNTYAVATTQYDSTNQQSLGVCYALNVKGGPTTVTANFSGSASYRRLVASEYSGVTSASAVDKTASTVATATTAANNVSSTAATTTAPGDLIFGAVMDDAGMTGITAGTGFTQRASVNNKDLATQDMVQAAAGSVASTQTFGAAHRYLAQMVAFKAAAASTPDTTPPVISSVSSTNVTTSGATIAWTTDENSDSQVQYGATTAYGSTTPLNGTLTTNHSVTLSGLTDNTIYHYRVVSKDAAGNVATSGDYTLQTQALPPPDTTPPAISSVTSSNVTTTTTTIGWATDEASDSQVQYGTTAAYGSNTPLNNTLTTTHAVNMVGLSASTTYHFRVVSKDAAGNVAASGDYSFTTPAAPTVGIVQTAGSTSDSNAKTIAQSFTTATTAGNLIAVAVSWGSNASITCSDSQGNTYAVATTQYDSTNQQSLGVCYAANIKGGSDTVTVTFSGNASYRRILVHEYKGLSKTNPVDVTAKNVSTATTGTNNVSSTSAATTANGDLIFGAVMDDSGTNNVTAGTGFTQRNSLNSKDLVSQDMIQATAGSVASTQTFSAAHRYLAQMVAFKAAN